MKRVILAMVAVFLSGSMFLNAAEYTNQILDKQANFNIAQTKRYVRKNSTTPLADNSQDYRMQSGIFLGGSLGGAEHNLKADLSAPDASYVKIPVDISGSAFDIGVVLGYKWAWEYVGVRAYGNLNYQSITLKGDKNTYKAHLINYGANIDALFRFYDFEKDFNTPVDIGAFIGLGLGGDSYLIGDDVLNDLAEGAKQIVPSMGTLPTKPLMDELKNNLAKDKFNAWLNVGLFTNIYKNHALEFGAKIPFIKHKMVEIQKGVLNIKASTKMSFILKISYIYTF